MRYVRPPNEEAGERPTRAALARSCLLAVVVGAIGSVSDSPSSLSLSLRATTAKPRRCTVPAHAVTPVSFACCSRTTLTSMPYVYAVTVAVAVAVAVAVTVTVAVAVTVTVTVTTHSLTLHLACQVNDFSAAALHYASVFDLQDVARLLIDYGADKSIAAVRLRLPITRCERERERTNRIHCSRTGAHHDGNAGRCRRPSRYSCASRQERFNQVGDRTIWYAAYKTKPQRHLTHSTNLVRSRVLAYWLSLRISLDHQEPLPRTTPHSPNHLRHRSHSLARAVVRLGAATQRAPLRDLSAVVTRRSARIDTAIRSDPIRSFDHISRAHLPLSVINFAPSLLSRSR